MATNVRLLARPLVTDCYSIFFVYFIVEICLLKNAAPGLGRTTSISLFYMFNCMYLFVSYNTYVHDLGSYLLICIAFVKQVKQLHVARNVDLHQ